MLKKELERRYGILGVWDTISSTDCLFSGNVGEYEEDGYIKSSGLRDPMMDVYSLIGDLKLVYYDIVVTISANGKCIVKVIQFRTKMGYDKYRSEKINIFE